MNSAPTGVQVAWNSASGSYGSFTPVSDAKTINAVYQYAVDYVDKIPYNTREGVQEVLNQIAPRNPKAKTAKPEEFYDDQFVKELDNQGFYKQLWK